MMSGKVKIGIPGSFLLEGNAKDNGSNLSAKMTFNNSGLTPTTSSLR